MIEYLSLTWTCQNGNPIPFDGKHIICWLKK